MRLIKYVKFQKEVRMTDEQLQAIDRGDDACLAYADGNKEFAAWLRIVDNLCWRFLRHSFFDIEDMCHPLDYYRDDIHPGEFFSDIVIEVMEYELGCVDVPEIVFNNVMWGTKQP